MAHYPYSKEVVIEEERFRRLIAWHRGELVGPIHLDVELHKRCNLNCVVCSRGRRGAELNEESKRSELPLSKWLSIVSDAAALGVRVWNVEGANEPLAHPMTFRILTEVKKAGMYGTMTTNGTLWTEKQARELVAMGWDRLHVSIDGVDAETHDRCRGVKGSFEKAMGFIGQLNRCKKELGTEWPMLNINTVVNRLNYRLLPEFVELAHEQNADYLFVEPVIPYHEDALSMRLDEGQMRELPRYVVEARALAEKYGIDNNFGTHDRNLDAELVEQAGAINSIHLGDVKDKPKVGLLAAPCYKPWMYLAIKYDGLVGHCGLVTHGQSIRDTGLHDIWYGDILLRVRQEMLRSHLGEHCLRCCPSDITQRRRWRGIFEDALNNNNIVNVRLT